MSNATSNGAGGKDVLRLLAQALAPYLRHQLKAEPSVVHQEYYDQKTSPLGRRKHMDLVRRGVLQGYKHGKSVFIRRNEVHEFIQSHTANSGPDDERDGVLDDWELTGRRQR